MGTRKLFWENPYQTTLETQVVAVCDDQITLRETIFFAFSGGQQSDAGTIAGMPVLRAEKVGIDIQYTLPAGHGLEPGDAVRVEIDSAVRLRVMRLHFAAELVLELVYQLYGHPEKVGANITDQKARVDFRWQGNINTTFPTVQQRIEALVAANLPIISAFSDEANERRYWEIAGFAKVPCGGTHPRRTGEVGSIALRRSNIGGGRERIEITLKD